MSGVWEHREAHGRVEFAAAHASGGRGDGDGPQNEDGDGPQSEDGARVHMCIKRQNTCRQTGTNQHGRRLIDARNKSLHQRRNTRCVYIIQGITTQHHDHVHIERNLQIIASNLDDDMGAKTTRL